MNSTILLPDDVDQVVTQRSKVYDSQTQRSRELGTLAKQIDTSGTAETISPLIDGDAPPDEVSAAIDALKAEIADMASTRREITSKEEEIQRIKSRIVSMYWTIGITLAIVIFILWAVLVS